MIHPITKLQQHQAVTEAIRAFEAKGGLIEQIPPETTPARRKAGNWRDGGFEDVFEFVRH